MGPVLTAARGRFITFEGGEGAGKSTQLRLLAERLFALQVRVRATREPGGTSGAEAIRDLVVQGTVDRFLPSTELLLMMAARDDHLRRVVLPALDDGQWVLCDRYVDSSRVYQGIAGGLGLALVDDLHRLALGGHMPDLTFLLDLDVQEGLRRRAAAGAFHRFEQKDLAFHQRVRDGFRDLAEAEPDRFVVIEARQSIPAVQEAIWRELEARLLS